MHQEVRPVPVEVFKARHSPRIFGLLKWLVIYCAPTVLLSAVNEDHSPVEKQTVLAILESRFTVNGQPTFLLGISYYAGLGASEDHIRRDLDDLQHRGFNWLRVWATWESFGQDISAVNSQGAPHEPFLSKLQWLIAECDRRCLIVDVTLTRKQSTSSAGGLADLASHGRAVETLINALKNHRNWYLDVANEHDVGDARHVSPAELKQLRDLARRLDPQRLVTASFGGHDLTGTEINEALVNSGLDFLTPHRPRNEYSPAQTEAQTRTWLGLMKDLHRIVPVHYQEPFRRGYGKWEPVADNFLTDLRGAIGGGAAGWCFHNGATQASADHQPRRSFDLSEKRLFEQLDPEERKVADNAAAIVSAVTRTIHQNTDRVLSIRGPSQSAAAETPFKVPPMWEYSSPLIAPEARIDNPSHAQKDPSIVFYEGKWHVFMTVKLPGKSAIEYCSFPDWKAANASPRVLLNVSDSAYYCAPQVFFFRPHGKWYLIYQVGIPGLDKMWVAYSTTTNITNPLSWTRAAPILDGSKTDPRKVGGLDYWVICDDRRAYLFLTSLDGKMWRLWTRLEDFPRGFGHCEVAIEATIFEASHTYKLKGMNQYLTIVEENGRRYYKAFVTDRLDGDWTPVANTEEHPFAGANNIRPATGVEAWTDNVSHGELVRDGCDETLTVDPTDLRFVFQGMFEKDKAGKEYGRFQWRIGMLTPLWTQTRSK